MSKIPRKSTRDIGPTKITATPQGQVSEINHTELPETKEELEAYFATRFVAQFNIDSPLGERILINDLKQNDTYDLDFSIKSAIADYLELAELNPRSEPFGRSAYRTCKLNVYEYARCIYFRIITRKARDYGETASRTILLLYFTHWHFFQASKSLSVCIVSFKIRAAHSPPYLLC
ncbi:MAG: hypothetical protein P8Y71_26835 [Pseudolabrys sp.]